MVDHNGDIIEKDFLKSIKKLLSISKPICCFKIPVGIETSYRDCVKGI